MATAFTDPPVGGVTDLVTGVFGSYVLWDTGVPSRRAVQQLIRRCNGFQRLLTGEVDGHVQSPVAVLLGDDLDAPVPPPTCAMHLGDKLCDVDGTQAGNATTVDCVLPQRADDFGVGIGEFDDEDVFNRHDLRELAVVGAAAVDMPCVDTQAPVRIADVFDERDAVDDAGQVGHRHGFDRNPQAVASRPSGQFVECRREALTVDGCFAEGLQARCGLQRRGA
jgi:hypothetical protein